MRALPITVASICVLTATSGCLKKQSHESGKQKLFDVGDSRISAVVKGSGDIVALLPAQACDVSYFEAITPRLVSAGYKTVAINPRGVGESKGPLVNITLHDLASDVAGVIKALGSGPVHVIGHAYGNRIARCLAADHPGMVRSVMLLAAGGRTKPSKTVRARWRELHQKGTSRLKRVQIARSLFFSPKTDRAVAHGFYRNKKQWPQVWRSQRKATQATHLEDWWDGGAAPMLVIQGLDDNVAPLENGRYLKKVHGERIELVELPDAGHMMPLEQPESVGKTIIEYLKRQ